MDKNTRSNRDQQADVELLRSVEKKLAAVDAARPPRPTDDRIVYGARCQWWDSIDKVATMPGGGLPICPHCGSVLYETTPAKWWREVDAYEADGNPGYRQMIEWARGKCFPTFGALTAAYTRPREVPET
jgi:hypothetical protein